jgi:hypothetical protein
MRTLNEFQEYSTDIIRTITGRDTGTKLYPIAANQDEAITRAIPHELMPEPIYSFPQGRQSISFPVETYNTPRFEGQVFSVDNPLHIALIREGTVRFSQELQNLKNCDRWLEASFVFWVGIKSVQFFLNNRPYAGHNMRTIHLQAATMNAFNLSDEAVQLQALFVQLRNRHECFKSYNLALQRLMHNMAWSCGYQADDQDAAALANSNELMEMVLTAAEVLTLKQIKDLIADPIEQAFLQQARVQQRGAGYSARREQNTLALYGTKASNPYYFFAAPIAWTYDVAVRSSLSFFRPSAPAVNNHQVAHDAADVNHPHAN